MAAGTRPFRIAVDFSNANVEAANALLWKLQEEYLTRMGFANLLHPVTTAPFNFN